MKNDANNAKKVPQLQKKTTPRFLFRVLYLYIRNLREIAKYKRKLIFRQKYLLPFLLCAVSAALRLIQNKQSTKMQQLQGIH